MVALGIALTLASLGAQAFGSMKSAQANNEWRRKLLEKSSSLDDVFNKEYNMNYMATPGVKNTLAAYAQGIKDINKNVEGRAAMAGSSAEAVIGEREKTNQNYGDFIRKIASGQDQYKQRTQNMYMLRRDNLDNQLMGAGQQKAAQWDNFMKNSASLGSAGFSAASIQDQEAGENKAVGGDQGANRLGVWLSGLLKKKATYSDTGQGEAW